MKGPSDIRIRMYNVGFGDCFLLSFRYDADKHRHLLIDFGSTGLPKDAERTRMTDIANNIAQTVGKEPFAVVATHRHADHISGFDPGAKAKGPGAIIAGLKPKLVVQPWTEDPKLPRNAKGPKLKTDRGAMGFRQKTLDALHDISKHTLLHVVPRLSKTEGLQAVSAELRFIGEDNLKNLAAVKQLQSMGPNEYVHADKPTRLSKFLPGVRVSVLGPPTVRQHAGVKKQRARDPDEYWHLRAAAFNLETVDSASLSASMAAPWKSGDAAPPNARWLIRRQRREHANSVLQLVRNLDSAMNNTSVILLFECGKQKLLFPGDAQIENWEYTLSQPKRRALLKDVTVYKVGHHGSLNATPLTLWKEWFPRGSKPKAMASRMQTFLSTLDGKHGSTRDDTEVPRRRLVTALKDKTRLSSTLGDKSPFEETWLKT